MFKPELSKPAQYLSLARNVLPELDVVCRNRSYFAALIFFIVSAHCTSWAIAFSYSSSNVHVRISLQIILRDASSVHSTLVLTAFIATIPFAYFVGFLLHFFSTLSQNPTISGFSLDFHGFFYSFGGRIRSNHAHQVCLHPGVLKHEGIETTYNPVKRVWLDPVLIWG